MKSGSKNKAGDKKNDGATQEADYHRAQLEADKKKRTDMCAKEVAASLEKHNCMTHIRCVIDAGSTPRFIVTILAKE
jgi:hypothetical protein